MEDIGNFKNKDKYEPELADLSAFLSGEHSQAKTKETVKRKKEKVSLFSVSESTGLIEGLSGNNMPVEEETSQDNILSENNNDIANGQDLGSFLSYKPRQSEQQETETEHQEKEEVKEKVTLPQPDPEVQSALPAPEIGQTIEPEKEEPFALPVEPDPLPETGKAKKKDKRRKEKKVREPLPKKGKDTSKKKKGHPIVLLISGVLFSLLIAAGGAYWYFTSYHSDVIENNVEEPSDTGNDLIHFGKEILELKTEEDTVNCGDNIDLRSYVSEFNGDSELVITPYNKDVLGDQIIIYETKNGRRSVTRKLLLHVVDMEPPVFELKTDYVEISSSEKSQFNCMDYVDVESFSDNHDSYEEMNFKATCPDLDDLKDESNGALINYELSDSSGNSSTKVLTVLITSDQEE